MLRPPPPAPSDPPAPSSSVTPTSADVAPSVTDAELLSRFAAGEREALGVLAERHERALLGVCLGLLDGRRDLACDAVQNTWIKVIRSARTFDGRSSVKTWLYRIAINAAKDVRAARARHASRAGGDGGERADGGASPASEPERPDVAALRAAVASLPEHQREVVLLCYHAGLSHTEVAALLAIPPGTVKSRLHHALAALRAALPKEEFR